MAGVQTRVFYLLLLLLSSDFYSQLKTQKQWVGNWANSFVFKMLVAMDFRQEVLMFSIWSHCDRTCWDAILSESTGSLSEHKLNNLIQLISAKYIYHRVAKLQGPT